MGTAQTDIGIDAATAISYWRRTARIAWTTAAGIALMIASCALPIISDYWLAGTSALPMAIFFLTVAAGILLISLPRRRVQSRHKRVRVATSTQALAERELQAYHQPYTIGLVFGICLCVVAPAAAVLDDRIGPAIFMLAGAIGVFFIVYVNLVAAGYKRLRRPYTRLR